MSIPRPEYPRPSWKRDNWLNLNGEWDFAIDEKAERNIADIVFDKKILVPFCPESKLSGIENVDFMEVVWYKKLVNVPAEWKGKRILLHFQAVDYDATIWIDGKLSATHRGCFTPITVDLGVLEKDAFTIVLRAQTLRDRNRPRGKQSEKLENYDCCYTRTSGIWQTVWLEPLESDVFMKRPRISPVEGGFDIEIPLSANRAGWRIIATAKTNGHSISSASASADLCFTPKMYLPIPEKERRLWSPEDPFLYDIELQLLNDKQKCVDLATAYCGLRYITIDGTKIMLNGKPMYQRLVLDQGYYPDGIWTAPSEDALVNDIKISMAAGFNGARLHQKVFEERFLYHADRLGYLVWGEFGDWGVDWVQGNQPDAGMYQPGLSMVGQWLEELQRDYNHPAIIGWCGLNETHTRTINGVQTRDVVIDLTKAIFYAAKNTDRTRPVLDASGYIHTMQESDIFDTHDYSQPDEIEAHLKSYKVPCICDIYPEKDYSVPWMGQPFFISEIGGIGWPVKPGDWSYGPAPKSEDEVLARLDRLFVAMHSDERVFGYCYTQLTDIYQECNGLYFFDRRPKFSVKALYEMQTRW